MNAISSLSKPFSRLNASKDPEMKNHSTTRSVLQSERTHTDLFDNLPPITAVKVAA
jgi:hypothetical protein